MVSITGISIPASDGATHVFGRGGLGRVHRDPNETVILLEQDVEPVLGLEDLKRKVQVELPWVSMGSADTGAAIVIVSTHTILDH